MLVGRVRLLLVCLLLPGHLKRGKDRMSANVVDVGGEVMKLLIQWQSLPLSVPLRCSA